MADRIGILGGSFDPIHSAHIRIAEAALQQLALDRVMFVVANQPWQKVDEQVVTDARIRFEMVEIALRDRDGLIASDIEIERGGFSYTIDTAKQLTSEYSGTELWLIIGSDVAASLSTWVSHEELADLVHLGVVVRPGYSVGSLDGWRSNTVEILPSETSATEIRKAIAHGENPEDLAPEVYEFIKKRGLYKENGD